MRGEGILCLYLLMCVANGCFNVIGSVLWKSAAALLHACTYVCTLVRMCMCVMVNVMV